MLIASFSFLILNLYLVYTIPMRLVNFSCWYFDYIINIKSRVLIAIFTFHVRFHFSTGSLTSYLSLSTCGIEIFLAAFPIMSKYIRDTELAFITEHQNIPELDFYISGVFMCLGFFFTFFMIQIFWEFDSGIIIHREFILKSFVSIKYAVFSIVHLFIIACLSSI